MSVETKNKYEDRLNISNKENNIIIPEKQEIYIKPIEEGKMIIGKEKDNKSLNKKEFEPEIKKHEISFNSELDSNILNLELLFQNEEIKSIQNCNELHILKSNKHKFISQNNLVFNVLVTGESGSGKTLFIKNFLKKIEKNVKNSTSHLKNKLDYNAKIEFDVYNSEDKLIFENDIQVGIPTKEFIEYRINNLSLTQNNKFRIIDSPGYSGTKDSQSNTTKVIEYINYKNQIYYNSKINSNENVYDCRIHLVLYFIYGPKPRMMDYLNIKELQSHVNIIPVIARGDNLGREGILKIKGEIYNNKNNYEIEFFDVHNTIKNFCKIEPHFNFLVRGDFGDCPPYFINYTNSFQENYYDHTNYDESDFIRLYYILVSYIPFDCIKQTKKRFYLNFKKSREKIDNEKMVSKKNCSYFFALIAIPIISVAFSIFSKNKINK